MSTNLPWEKSIPKDKAALYFLGQAGYVIQSDNCTILIDPYLSDSVGKTNALFSRIIPIPIDPAKIKADIVIITHDHMDHLDPETIGAYKHKNTTIFVSPRHAAKKLMSLGVPSANIRITDHGDETKLPGVSIKGIYALATEPGVLDTTGYLISFSNGRSVYHTSDTAYNDLLLKSCPNAEVLLTCINGKFGNLNIAQAVELTKAVNPKIVIPNHYDVMLLNSEQPQCFKYSCESENVKAQCVILDIIEQFLW